MRDRITLDELPTQEEGQELHTLTTAEQTPTGVPSAPTATTGPVARAVAPLSSLPAWVASAGVYAASAAAFFGSGAGFAIPTVQRICGQAPPDMRVTSTATEVHRFLSDCGSAGRQAYGALQVADLIYPLVFAVFLASSLALVLRLLAPDRPGLLGLAAVPFVASAFDYLENACAWLALAAWPQPGAADGLLGHFSTAKTATSWVAGTLLLLVLGALAVRHGWALLARHHRRDTVGAGGRR